MHIYMNEVLPFFISFNHLKNAYITFTVIEACNMSQCRRTVS